MSIALAVLLFFFCLGFFGIISGVIYSNYAVQQMRAVLNQNRSADDQLEWHDAIQRVAQKVIDAYRSEYPNGSLSRKLTLGYWIAGIGGGVDIASAVLMKFTN